MKNARKQQAIKEANDILNEGILCAEKAIDVLSSVQTDEVQEPLEIVKDRLRFFKKVGLASNPAEGMLEYAQVDKNERVPSIVSNDLNVVLMHGMTLLVGGIDLIEYSIDDLENKDMDWLIDSLHILKEASRGFIQTSTGGEHENVPKFFKSTFNEILRWA